MMQATREENEGGSDIALQGPEEIKQDLLDQMKAPLEGPTPVRDKLAAVGAIKAMVLDRIYPAWKKGFIPDGYGLGELLKFVISVPDPLKDFPVTSVKLNGKKLIVALADNPARWKQGLQHVADISPLEGMLFVFPQELRTGFWMKDTEMALQIGFFNSRGELLESVTLQPCRSSSCPSHTPEETFQYVLELPADSEINLAEAGDLLARPSISGPAE